MSIGIRIILGYLAGLLLLVTIGSVAYTNTLRLLDEMELVKHTDHVLERINAVLSTLRDLETGVRGYVLTGREDFLMPYRSGQNLLQPAIDDVLRLTVDNPSQQARGHELQMRVHTQTDQWQDLLRLCDKKGFEAGRLAIAEGTTKQGMDELRRIARAMTDEEERLLRQRNQANQNAARETRAFLVWGTLLAAIAMMLLGGAVTRSITAPLRVVMDGAAQIGRGNLGFRVNLRRSDEMGALAAAIDRMTDDLGKTLVSADSERKARERVELLLSEIADTSNKLVSATAEIMAATAQQAAGAQEQAAAVAQTVSSANQVAHTSEQAAARAHAVAQKGLRALDASETGRRVINESTQAMGVIKEQVDASAERIQSLAEGAQAIGVIIASVTDLAEQTNVLALNAAIEASRAGEYGRGFRVVAAEIKALAIECKRGTAQVLKIVSDVQRAIGAAVMQTEQCSKNVTAAGKVILQAGDTISSLAEAVVQSSQTASEIAASAGQQAAGTSQIHQAMRSIDQAVSQNLGATRQMELAAGDLNALGARLRERLSGFDRNDVEHALVA